MKGLVQYIRESLSTKLGLGIVLLAVPIFVVALGILFLQSRHIIREEAIKRATSVLSTNTQRVRGFLDAVEMATESNAWLVTEHLNPDSFLSISRRIVALNPCTSGCSISAEPYLFPECGRNFSVYTIRQGDSLIAVREKDYDFYSRVWYKVPKDLGKASWVDFYDDHDTLDVTLEGMIASYCKPINDHDGRLLAVVSTDLELTRLSELVTANSPYRNSYFAMIGSDGTYVVHPHADRLFKETIFSGGDPNKHDAVFALGVEMTKGHTGNKKVELDGRSCIVCYQPVPGTRWSMALVCPESDIFYSYYLLGYILVPLLLVGLVLILLLIRRAVKHAIKPLNMLLQQSQRIAEGHYDEQIPHTQKRHVVGRLQNSFATMQESLAQRIGEVQKAHDETIRRNEELQQASQLVEESVRQKTAFIQNVTHQIRTPLNIIMGFTQVLRDINQLPREEAEGMMDIVRRNVATLSRMVLMLYDSSETGMNEELDASKTQDMVSCNEVARESISYASRNFPQLNIKFETELPDSRCISTNRVYLMRSLREILYNSAKYSDGQHIMVHVSEQPSTIRFLFQDTGPGISEDYRERMFVPFTKSDDLSEGLGLGLALSKRHIDNLGGQIWLDPDYHEGCRFVIDIPIKE